MQDFCTRPHVSQHRAYIESEKSRPEPVCALTYDHCADHGTLCGTSCVAGHRCGRLSAWVGHRCGEDLAGTSLQACVAGHRCGKIGRHALREDLAGHHRRSSLRGRLDGHHRRSSSGEDLVHALRGRLGRHALREDLQACVAGKTSCVAGKTWRHVAGDLVAALWQCVGRDVLAGMRCGKTGRHALRGRLGRHALREDFAGMRCRSSLQNVWQACLWQCVDRDVLAGSVAGRRRHALREAAGMRCGSALAGRQSMRCGKTWQACVAGTLPGMRSGVRRGAWAGGLGRRARRSGRSCPWTSCRECWARWRRGLRHAGLPPKIFRPSRTIPPSFREEDIEEERKQK